MIYSGNQLAILHHLKAGKTFRQIARELRISHQSVERSLRLLRQRNNIKSLADLKKYIAILVLPSAPPKKETKGIYLRRWGGYELRVKYQGKYRYVNMYSTQQHAIKERRKVLADPQMYFMKREKRTNRQRYIRMRGSKYSVEIYIRGSGARKFLGTKNTLEEAIALRDEYLNGTTIRS